ncbi:T9SS type A sorting domain-containing protein [Flavobacterium sp. W22_SRS_FP1]|uniref:T9SS type A sorting domain-containing protein n=1 Tax=Flavobacterium sp. W22_SRS_FP1 TaxID=3240276 RepID=UPI003F919F4C
MFVNYQIVMKYVILLLISISGFSQDLHHQMLSSQGKSVVMSNGVLISQTIGQQSAIGNFKNGYTVGQGFQQSNWKKIVAKNIETNISTITFPNPFISRINFQFSKQITDKIQIAIFDVRGRLIFQQEKRANNNILTIDLESIASSNYLVKLTAENYTYYTQILKKQ